MQRVDVAVAGSGPAGAACALRLARDGLSVALIDAAAFPREKLCGEYLNLGAIRELRDLEVGQALRERAQPLDGMRLFAHGEEARFALPSEAWSIPRTVLDSHVRAAALQAGVQAVLGRVRRLELGNADVLVEWSDAAQETHALRARYLVGADGMHSAVARLCNLTVPAREQRFALGAHYRGIDLGRWIEMYACAGEYVALNPLDDSCANAVFVLRKRRLVRSRMLIESELTAFSDRATAGRRVLLQNGFESKCRAIGPLAHRTSRPTLKRVLLVGDAAAFVDPFTGQGVFLALAGAREAAAAIRAALDREQSEAAAWQRYAAAVQERVAERSRVAAMMKLMLSARFASRRAADALRKRPGDFTFLIEAVSGNAAAGSSLQLVAAVGKVLR